MRYQRIDLNLLVALDILLAERNVTRAAERLHITQSAASGVLSRLRDYFEDPLLVQVGRDMRLTPLAESLVDQVRDIIVRIDSTMAARPEFDPGEAQRHFVIIASDYVSRVLMADVLQRISALAPAITFELRPTSPLMVRDIEQGRVDLLITPAHLVSADHPSTPLFDDTYTVVAWDQNPICKKGLTLDTYHSAGHVAYRYGRGGNPWFEQWYANQHAETRRVEVITHDFNLISRFVIGTNRLATVQTRLATQFEESMPVRLFPLPMNTPRLVEVLQWHKYRETDPGCMWLREQIIETARQLPVISD
ncbi:LysR family transcriptional regulator [Pusillimonas noertemannii]|uniref:LysR family transcriptional regulator n=1 Tax=Pusillimonas noertemannii TaxID=305977 RepID=A0A2U1CPF1_9BURK|nr:LysR family transcriptional regulator [Pusillimonas noertemannii]NYT67085.1 LysR family transcriptional regulator [Pusillimonas noertemannii]PVY67759.1 LysR family transcriptional regulator [Pusillimonas noertemannii]TFL12709.1 LysR family transcriptional regulator [Pusillimonas noertemannii]